VVTLTEQLWVLGIDGAVFTGVLLIIGGIEQNLGPVMEVENTVQHLYTGCGRNTM
jgi:hypothetical protein